MVTAWSEVFILFNYNLFFLILVALSPSLCFMAGKDTKILRHQGRSFSSFVAG